MIDNNKVSDNHQQGIERVKMRKGELETNAQSVSMCGGWKHGKGGGKSDSFKQYRNSMTPRKA